MSESTHDDTTPATPQAQNWDDILSQPIARLADDAAAPEGGWRGVREIGDFSPRRQTAPVQLTPVDSVMKLRLPRQAEEEAPQQAKLPDSLADQLSLTWASRRRQRPAEEPEDTGPDWPSSSPAAARAASQQVDVATAPVDRHDTIASAPAQTPLWRRPLDLVTRAFRRETPPVPGAATTATSTAPPAQHEAPPTPQATNLSPASPVAAPHTTVQRQADPTPSVTPRLDEANPYEEEDPKQPGAKQEQEPVDLTLAMQPSARAAETPMTPKPLEEEDEAKSTPAVKSDSVQQTPATAPIPVARRDEVDTPAPSRPQTPRSLGDAAPEQDEEPSRRASPEPERRSFLSWLRPRDVARAPVDREPAADTDAAPSEAPSVRQTPQPDPDVALAPVQRAPEPQQSSTLPVGDTPLTLRTSPQPEVEADTREDAAATPAAPAATAPAASTATPEPGDPLPPGLQQRMEGLLDVPLREVRIFRGQTSQRLTSQMRADAVTVGNQIHVAPGRGDPSQPQGRALLGHELSHVASRNAGAAPVARDDDASAPDTQAPVSLAPDVSPEQDEARAMRLEHAMLRSDTPAPSRPVAQPPAPLALEHRTPPPQIVVSPDAMAGLQGSHADGWGGHGAAFQAALNDAATAPWDRLAEEAESMAGSAANSAIDAGSALASEGLQAAGSAASSAIGNAVGDEDGLIDRVVDAVISRIEQEGAVARERGSSFVPHFGG